VQGPEAEKGQELLDSLRARRGRLSNTVEV
jgi:hypothetical protein